LPTRGLLEFPSKVEQQNQHYSDIKLKGDWQAETLLAVYLSLKCPSYLSAKSPMVMMFAHVMLQEG